MVKSKYGCEIGKKVNMLRLDEIIIDPPKRRHCMVTCECGKSKKVRLDSYLSGRYYSCGCHAKNRPNVTCEKNGAFAGVGDIRGVHFVNISTQAKKRGKIFSVSRQYLWDLFVRQNNKCALSGVPIKFGRVYFKHETTASLDRIDSSKGYIEGNVQWVHKDVNRMKNDFKQSYFLEMCKHITQLLEASHKHIHQNQYQPEPSE